jgi:ferredoxin
MEPIALHLNARTCAASQNCVGLAPALFRYDSVKGHSEVISEIVEDAGLIALARQAEEICPSGSISAVS